MLSLTKQEKTVLIFLLILTLIGLGSLYFKKSRQNVTLKVVPLTK